MAKPDTDDGWLKYAHELDAALAVADFTKGARIVLREVFAQIFGPAKLKTARVSPGELSRRCGMKREALSRSIRELTEANVLLLQSDGSFRFNKNYETWLQGIGRGQNGKATGMALRFTPTEVAYCCHAPVTALSYQQSSRNQSDTGTDVVDRNQSDTESVTKVTRGQMSDRNQSDTESVTKVTRAEAPPYVPPCINSRLKDSLSGEGEALLENVIEIEEPRPTAKAINSPDDVHRTLKAIHELFPMDGMESICQQWLVDYPARRIIAALTDAKQNQASKPTKYIQSILDKPERPASNGHAASAAVSRPAPERPRIGPHPGQAKEPKS